MAINEDVNDGEWEKVACHLPLVEHWKNTQKTFFVLFCLLACHNVYCSNHRAIHVNPNMFIEKGYFREEKKSF